MVEEREIKKDASTRQKKPQHLMPFHMQYFGKKRTLLIGLLILACIAGILFPVIHFSKRQAHTKQISASVKKNTFATSKKKKAQYPVVPKVTHATKTLGEEIVSKYAILIDLNTNKVLAEKNAQAVISPASMTKIMTILVAAEHLKNLKDTCTITSGITDYCYRNGCSAVNFSVGETVSVQDLFYGTILPSGADAALALATYTAGSPKAFVVLMNDKLQELGLAKTAHFTNCIGLYDKDHHCTVRDMAIILHAAVQNNLCRKVLSTHTYTIAATSQHPSGLPLSNWFLRRIEDKDTGDPCVVCAKTGFVTQSGSCAASYATDTAGHEYICVTGMSTSSWRCIYDHVALYKQFANSAVS